MNVWGRIEDMIFWAATAAITALFGGIGWLIRRVLTNEAQIALLQQEIKHRDQLRNEDREVMGEIKDSVDGMKDFLMGSHHHVKK